jgi:hypothetical protein
MTSVTAMTRVTAMSSHLLSQVCYTRIYTIDMSIYCLRRYIICSCRAIGQEVTMLRISSCHISMSSVCMTWSSLSFRAHRSNSHCNYTHLEDIFFRDFPSFIREESREFFMKFWDDFFLYSRRHRYYGLNYIENNILCNQEYYFSSTFPIMSSNRVSNLSNISRSRYSFSTTHCVFLLHAWHAGLFSIAVLSSVKNSHGSWIWSNWQKLLIPIRFSHWYLENDILWIFGEKLQIGRFLSESDSPRLWRFSIKFSIWGNASWNESGITDWYSSCVKNVPFFAEIRAPIKTYRISIWVRLRNSGGTASLIYRAISSRWV